MSHIRLLGLGSTLGPSLELQVYHLVIGIRGLGTGVCFQVIVRALGTLPRVRPSGPLPAFSSRHAGIVWVRVIVQVLGLLLLSNIRCLQPSSQNLWAESVSAA